MQCVMTTARRPWMPVQEQCHNLRALLPFACFLQGIKCVKVVKLEQMTMVRVQAPHCSGWFFQLILASWDHHVSRGLPFQANVHLRNALPKHVPYHPALQVWMFFWRSSMLRGWCMEHQPPAASMKHSCSLLSLSASGSCAGTSSPALYQQDSKTL